MQSAVISYTLTVALLIPVSGWLADRFGTVKFLLLRFLYFLVALYYVHFLLTSLFLLFHELYKV